MIPFTHDDADAEAAQQYAQEEADREAARTAAVTDALASVNEPLTPDGDPFPDESAGGEPADSSVPQPEPGSPEWQERFYAEKARLDALVPPVTVSGESALAALGLSEPAQPVGEVAGADAATAAGADAAIPGADPDADRSTASAPGVSAPAPLPEGATEPEQTAPIVAEPVTPTEGAVDTAAPPLTPVDPQPE